MSTAVSTAQSNAAPTDRRAFHVMTKPVGPICNLDCKYCFYLEKVKLYPGKTNWRMSDEVLEQYVRQYIEQQNVPEISFAWQGGEPTLLGVDFFRKVVALQKQYANGKRIANAFQTNGTLLDDEWCEFFRENNFLIGLSIDGPAELHDVYRVDKQNNPTFDAVMRGQDFLKKHKAEFNTLTVVNRVNSQKPLDVYNFLKQIGSSFIQFIPLVERAAPTRLKILGFDFAEPPLARVANQELSPVTSWSVESEQYGTFLIKIFEEWIKKNVGKTFVQLFDVALGNWLGVGSSLCVFAETCGSALAMEHNGDVYSCDHFVYGKYKLGNLMNHSLGEMVSSAQQKNFGQEKLTTLPQYCRDCSVRFACNGECPKHRFIKTPDGEDGLNYLCAGYKKFFTHVDPAMKRMAALLRANRPAADIMSPLKVNPDHPCPCGSGMKFKRCCGKP